MPGNWLWAALRSGRRIGDAFRCSRLYSLGVAVRSRKHCSAIDNSVSCPAMTIKEHDCVVLTADLPSERLKAGDVGTVVHIHNGGAGYEVEFMTFAGNTIAVATVDATALRPVGERDLSHVRELQSA